jgi:integrase
MERGHFSLRTSHLQSRLRHSEFDLEATLRTLGSVYERGGIWYCRFYYRGREYRYSSRSPKRKDALALLEKKRDEVISRRLAPGTDRASFSDLAKLIEQDYVANERKSLREMKGRLKQLRKRLGNMLAVDITHAKLTDYANNRRREGAKPATIRYELAVLGRMFTLAIQGGLLINRPPLPAVKVANARKGFFETEEFGRVLDALPIDIGPAIAFAYLTGWRIGEIRNLTWARVDFTEGIVRLEPGETKNNEGRTFPFGAHAQLQPLLKVQRERVELLQRRLTTVIPWVFPREDGSQLGTFYKAWKTACKKAECEGKLVHDLRRTAVRNLVRANVAERVAMTLTGHKTRAVFDRYDIVNEADLADAVRKLSERSS